jgi:hypothetical protein
MPTSPTNALISVRCQWRLPPYIFNDLKAKWAVIGQGHLSSDVTRFPFDKGNTPIKRMLDQVPFLCFFTHNPHHYNLASVLCPHHSCCNHMMSQNDEICDRSPSPPVMDGSIKRARSPSPPAADGSNKRARMQILHPKPRYQVQFSKLSSDHYSLIGFSHRVGLEFERECVQ